MRRPRATRRSEEKWRASAHSSSRPEKQKAQTHGNDQRPENSCNQALVKCSMQIDRERERERALESESESAGG